jgi:hypothetical protein
MIRPEHTHMGVSRSPGGIAAEQEPEKVPEKLWQTKRNNLFAWVSHTAGRLRSLLPRRIEV